MKGEQYSKTTRYLMAKARDKGAGPLWQFHTSAEWPVGTIRIVGSVVQWSKDVRDAVLAYERTQIRLNDPLSGEAL